MVACKRQLKTAQFQEKVAGFVFELDLKIFKADSALNLGGMLAFVHFYLSSGELIELK